MAGLECVRGALGDVGDDLTDDEIRAILDDLQRRLDARRAAGRLDSVEDELFAEAEEIAGDIELASLIEKRNAAANQVIHAERHAEIGLYASPAEGIEAVNVGINRDVAGARDSVDARAQALESTFLGGLIADLRREDLLRFLTDRSLFGRGDGPLDRAIAQELWEIGRREGRPGIAGSPEAKRIAEIVAKWTEEARQRQNRAGAFIRRMPGYITRQSHDITRLRADGFEAWRDFILPRLDAERTFGGAEIDRFLKAAYDGLVTGEHMKVDPKAPLIGFKGPGNLAKRLSQPRVLHFASADDWFDYNLRFGHRSLVESVVSNLTHAARNIAVMEKWGSNPRAMFDRVLSDLRQRHRDNPKAVDALHDPFLDFQFKEVDGTTRVPAAGRLTWARVGHTARATQTMAKLGGATISSVTDIPILAAEMRHQGDGLLDGYKVALENIGAGRRAGEQREIADLIGAGIEGLVGDIAARFSATDQIPGTMSKLVQRFMKLNLLSWWTDAHKTGAGLIMARRLAQLRNTGWDGLKPERRRVLSQHGIEAAEWDVLRTHAVRATPEGGEFMMPDLVRDIPDEALAPLINGQPSRRNLARMRDRLEAKLQGFYADRIDTAVLTPGARERAIANRGTQSGSAEGEALRYFFQFKQFPITVVTRAWGSLVGESGFWKTLGAVMRGRGGLLGTTHMIAAMTVLGYAAMAAKDVSKGRTPRDPRDARTWAAAFVQGGGAGIYGDFLFGEYNRFGGGLAATFGGPTIGTVEDLARVFARFRSGEDATSELFHVTKNNTPFLNLFYTRAALDYLVFYQLQEMLNPGYLARMERRIRDQNSQRFLIPPSRAVPRGGGDRVLEGVR